MIRKTPRDYAVQILIVLSFLLVVPLAPAAMPGVKDLPVRVAMPDPLINNAGEKVTTADQWKIRREEMKAILAEYEFGHVPPPPGNVSGTELQSLSLMDGKVSFRLVHLTFGLNRKLGFNIAIFTPAVTDSAKGPFPTIVHLSMYPPPGMTVTTAPTTRPTTRAAGGRGGFFRPSTPQDIARQYQEALGRGYAVVTINYQQLGADNVNFRKSAFFPAYPDYDWNDIAAWSWGISRCIDYLQDQPFADQSKIIATGVSRLAQAVLHAGAFDDRIALTAPVCGGCAFRFCGKDYGGKQGVDEIIDQNTFWFGPRFPEFYKNTDKLPFDQHWLLALAAPRYYILCNALDDQYCNGNAAAQTYLGAKPVYDLLGVSDHLGENFRPGGHGMPPSDWVTILDFADQKLRNLNVNRRFDQLPPADQLH